MKKSLLLLLTLCLAFAACPALANIPYDTLTYDSDDSFAYTQTAYEPIRTMIRFGDETLKTASDLRLGPDGNLYICDTGNKRILVVTKQGELVKIIGDKDTLKSPKGVFVAANLDVYVADENARAVIVFNAAGEVIRTYGRPTHPLFGDTAPYKPNKVILDKRGNLYISSTGNTNGLIQISPVGEGEFLGYYGANTSIVNFLTVIRKAILTENQLSTMAGIVPTSVKNMCIDSKGMVYTVAQSENADALRKLNVAGKNILKLKYWLSHSTAVSVNSSGSIFTANASGYITEYTAEGDMLFVFGAFDNGQQRMGMFKSVTGLVVDDDYTLYVLDEILNNIQVFTPTEFADLVHSAFTLFQDGKYADSKAPWTEVLRMNSLFTYANTGLGEAQYREGNFEEALSSFKNGKNYTGYSDAFWELRSNWMHQNLGKIIIWLAVLLVVFYILKAVNKKTHFFAPVSKAVNTVSNYGIINKTLYCFKMIKNPFDACYGIKREGRASYLSGFIVLLIFFVWHVVTKYFSGFLFRTMPDGYYELFNDVLMVFGVFLLLVICCYLVCTIKEGEATFRDIFIGAAYALAPMLLLQPVVLILSNVLTYNEEFFITLLNFVMYGWTGVLIVLMLMYLNDYSFGKTVRVILWTAVTVLITVALLFVSYVLISQLVDFIVSIYGEVVYRFVKA